MMESRVTAIIPTLGRPELHQAVASALTQSVPMEVIVVVADPVQVHQVSLILDGIESRHLRIITPRARLNGSMARNLGVESASSEMVAFLDDDDWWAPTKTEVQVEAVPKGDAAFVISTDSFFGKAADQSHLHRPRRVPQAHHHPGHRMADYLLARGSLRYGRTFLQTSSLLAPTSLILQHRWDENLRKHQDWDLLIRLVDGERATHVPVAEPLTFVRKGSASSVSKALDWQASLHWVEALDADPRAVSDFISSTVIRPSLLAKEYRGMAAGLRALRGLPLPRPAALFGILEGALRSAVTPTREHR